MDIPAFGLECRGGFVDEAAGDAGLRVVLGQHAGFAVADKQTLRAHLTLFAHRQGVVGAARQNTVDYEQIDAHQVEAVVAGADDPQTPNLAVGEFQIDPVDGRLADIEFVQADVAHIRGAQYVVGIYGPGETGRFDGNIARVVNIDQAGVFDLQAAYPTPPFDAPVREPRAFGGRALDGDAPKGAARLFGRHDDRFRHGPEAGHPSPKNQAGVRAHGQTGSRGDDDLLMLRENPRFGYPHHARSQPHDLQRGSPGIIPHVRGTLPRGKDGGAAGRG